MGVYHIATNVTSYYSYRVSCTCYDVTMVTLIGYIATSIIWTPLSTGWSLPYRISPGPDSVLIGDSEVSSYCYFLPWFMIPIAYIKCNAYNNIIAYGQQWSESTLVLAKVNHDNNNSIIIVALVCLTTSSINLSLQYHGRAFSFEGVVHVHTCVSIQLVGEIINAPKACIRAPMVYSPPYSEDSAHRRLLIIPTFSPPWQAVPTMFIASTISQTTAGITLYTHNTSVYEGPVQAHIISSWYSGDSIHMHVHMSHISCTYIYMLAINHGNGLFHLMAIHPLWMTS